MRPDFAFFSASIPRWMSRSLARHRPATVESLITPATACTASKSPFEEAGKPASITSTRILSSCRAMRSFSSLVIEAPGLCSPSRMVVSNMISLSFMVPLQGEIAKASAAPACAATGYCRIGFGIMCARGAAADPPEAGCRRGASTLCGEGARAKYSGFPGLLQPGGFPAPAFLPQPVHVPGEPVCDKQQEEDDGRVCGDQDEA